MESPTPLPGGPLVGVYALEAAIARIHEAQGRIFAGGGLPTSAAIGEALLWLAGLDNHHRRATTGYDAIRAHDVGGRTASGLIYARNLLGHGLHMAGAVRFLLGDARVVVTPPGEEPPPRGRGTVLSARFEWAPLDELPAPGEPERWGKDQMYADQVAGRPVTEPLDVAHAWFAGLA